MGPFVLIVSSQIVSIASQVGQKAVTSVVLGIFGIPALKYALTVTQILSTRYVRAAMDLVIASNVTLATVLEYLKLTKRVSV